MTAASVSGNTLAFTYDDNGIRTSKTVNGVEHVYNVSGSTILSEAWGNHLIMYMYDDNGQPVGMQYRDTAYAANTFDTYWFEKNLQGDIVAVYNANGTKLISYTYDAWGNFTTTYSNGGASTSAIYNPFRYRSYYYDTELGLYYLNSRYYDSNTGRFINADGVLNDTLLGYNLFAYCVNNPVNYVDSDGDMPKWLAATLAVAAGVVVAAAIVTALPAAACAIGFSAGLALGTSSVISVATGIAYVGGLVVAGSAAILTADSVYTMTTGETVLLDTVFQENEDAYNTAVMLTSMATAGYMYMANVGMTHGMCFVAGTLVATADGNMPIENVETGMLVYAHNPETGETALKPVVNTFVNETDELVHVVVNGEEIITTPTHPFYVPVKGWTDAIQLRAGDRLQLLNGEYVIVEQIQHEILETPIQVYNFEVEDFHTYYVTESSILVHNANCGGYNLNGAKDSRYVQKRQWNDDMINTAINNGRRGTSVNLANGAQCTVYCYPGTNHYVVIEDISRSLIQLSKFTDPNWIPDANIIWDP